MQNSDLNARSKKLCDEADADALGLARSYIEGAELINFAPDQTGTREGGILLARICMADLAAIEIGSSGELESDFGTPMVRVQTDHPLNACIAAQYAGWPLSAGKFFAMCSGPARIARGKEKLLSDYGLPGEQRHVVGVLESRQSPTAGVIAHVAEECGVSPDSVTLCIAPTASLPGLVQIVARSIETTMHKLYEIGFDLRKVKSATGVAPLPPSGNDDLVSLGQSNDAMLYGALTELWLECDDDEIERIGPNVPSESSADFGTPFIDIFERYDRDFYKIDKLLFSPACVKLNSVHSGRSFQFGQVRPDIILASFGG